MVYLPIFGSFSEPSTALGFYSLMYRERTSIKFPFITKLLFEGTVAYFLSYGPSLVDLTHAHTHTDPSPPPPSSLYPGVMSASQRPNIGVISSVNDWSFGGICM